MKAKDEAHDHTNAEVQAKLAELHATLADQAQALSDRDAQISTLGDALQIERDALAARLAELEAERCNVASLVARLAELESSLQARDAALIARDELLQARDELLQARNQALQVQDLAIQDRDHRLAELDKALWTERDQTDMLRRLIYEADQHVIRDVEILRRLEVVEHLGEAIETRSEQIQNVLHQEALQTAAIFDHSQRTWRRHLPSPREGVKRVLHKWGWHSSRPRGA
ncbi:hypothetical protein BH23PLA1_BH23PLA1_16760 [soil metagenome]